MPFTRPTLQQLIDRARADVEARLPGVDAHLRRSLAAMLATVHAGAVHGLYGQQAWLARQLFPDTAEAEFLDRQGGIRALPRKAAVAATGLVDFTGTDGAKIPAGTLLQRSDGEQFSTDADATIAGGTAQAAVTAVEGGADGDTAAGTTLTLVTPIAGVDSEATATAGGLAGGLDTESDEDYAARLLLRWQFGPPNGKAGDYVQWALEVAGVTQAWAFDAHLGLGTVGVYFTRDNDAMDATIIPNGAQVQAVQDHIDTVRPRPAAVTVIAPSAVALNFTIQLTPNTAAVQAAVEAELIDLIRRDTSPGGTLRLSRINEAISLAEGETDHVLTSPAADVARSTGEISVMGAITWA
jgi:uncharacterized phage protein gp47/JayE